MCVRKARPSGRARCGAGAGCSAIRYQSLLTACPGPRQPNSLTKLTEPLLLRVQQLEKRTPDQTSPSQSAAAFARCDAHRHHSNRGTAPAARRPGGRRGSCRACQAFSRCSGCPAVQDEHRCVTQNPNRITLNFTPHTLNHTTLNFTPHTLSPLPKLHAPHPKPNLTLSFTPHTLNAPHPKPFTPHTLKPSRPIP